MMSMARNTGPDSLNLTLLLSVLALLALGLTMVMSTSLYVAEQRLGDAYFYVERQAIYLTISLMAMWVVYQVPISFIEQAGPWLFGLGLVLLILVLIPGIGHSVKGSSRWIPLGFFNLQVSEVVKLTTVAFMAGYLTRREVLVQTTWAGFMRPFGLLMIPALLLLAEPDFGATSVLMVTVLGMMFLAGARLLPFFALAGLMAIAAAMLVYFEPYRWARFTTFLEPWDHAFGNGYQLIQALIAFGRGEWFGVGLGASVQKLAYLPEVHTDFLFAIIGEELGLIGASIVIALFFVVFWQAMLIHRRAREAGMAFHAHLAAGLGLGLGVQALVNMAVNMGMLPTKGLTLPFMSYGGSSLLAACVAVALLLRVQREWVERDTSKQAQNDGEVWACAS